MIEASKALLKDRISTSECSSAAILPALFKLHGEPLSLQGREPFEVLFEPFVPLRFVLRCGRQVSKSTTLALLTILRSWQIPHFRTLVVHPLHSQSHRFSNLYVQSLLRNSALYDRFVDATCVRRVLQRSFTNGSVVHFSYISKDVLRVLGISADQLFIDEVQDILPEHIPQTIEVLSASAYGYIGYTGTPRSMENTIETIWRSSSMAEWFIPCTHCTTEGHRTWNIPSVEFHLEKMIGPYRDDISPEKPAVVCHKCGGILYPKMGKWVHRYRDRQDTTAGYHVPQPILEIHYGSPRKWADLLAKQSGAGFFTYDKFLNDVLGEAADVADSIIAYSDLLNACVLDPPDLGEAVKKRQSHRYVKVALGIDWGGGGKDHTSRTVVVAVGMIPGGKLECFYYQELPNPHDYIGEAEALAKLYVKLVPDIIAHDYGGKGELAEGYLVQSGVPVTKLAAMMYVGHMKHMIQYSKVEGTGRGYYQLARNRSLMFTAHAIRTGRLLIAKDKNFNPPELGMPGQFLNLKMEKRETDLMDKFLVVKTPGTQDDFAHALNIAACSIWHAMQAWPKIPT